LGEEIAKTTTQRMGARQSAQQYEMLMTASNETDQLHQEAVPILLTPYQSCLLHGWANPKRMLTWNDMSTSKFLTFQLCLQSGLSPSALHMMQPSIHQWIEKDKVTLVDVPHMTIWPLHPIEHLRGDISDLATMHYDAEVLSRMNITYPYMRKELLMDDEWMKMMRYKPREWAQHLQFDSHCAEEMGNMRVMKVFGMDLGMLKLAMSSAC
jgi:hypothetical protein